MNRDLGVWTSEDSALVLIDYQAELLEAIRSETGADLVELHARWLAKTAKAFDIGRLLLRGGRAVSIRYLPAASNNVFGLRRRSLRHRVGAVAGGIGWFERIRSPGSTADLTRRSRW